MNKWFLLSLVTLCPTARITCVHNDSSNLIDLGNLFDELPRPQDGHTGIVESISSNNPQTTGSTQVTTEEIIIKMPGEEPFIYRTEERTHEPGEVTSTVKQK